MDETNRPLDKFHAAAKRGEAERNQTPQRGSMLLKRSRATDGNLGRRVERWAVVTPAGGPRSESYWKICGLFSESKSAAVKPLLNFRFK